jgi:nitroreductase
VNEVLKALVERRSIRQYTDADVSDSDLKTILETAAYTPTARNIQAWHLTVIRGLEKIALLNSEVRKASQIPGFDRYREMTGNPSYSINFHKAPVFLITGVDPAKSLNPAADGTLVQAYILLAAHSLGLGACWINQLGAIGREPGFRAYLDSLGFPAGCDIIGCVCLGHTDSYPGLPERNKDKYNIVN